MALIKTLLVCQLREYPRSETSIKEFCFLKNSFGAFTMFTNLRYCVQDILQWLNCPTSITCAIKNIPFVRSGIRTHAWRTRLRPERSALFFFFYLYSIKHSLQFTIVL